MQLLLLMCLVHKFPKNDSCLFSQKVQLLVLPFLMSKQMINICAQPLCSKVSYHLHPHSPIWASLFRHSNSSMSCTSAALISPNRPMSRHSQICTPYVLITWFQSYWSSQYSSGSTSKISITPILYNIWLIPLHPWRSWWLCQDGLRLTIWRLEALSCMPHMYVHAKRGAKPPFQHSLGHGWQWFPQENHLEVSCSWWWLYCSWTELRGNWYEECGGRNVHIMGRHEQVGAGDCCPSKGYHWRGKCYIRIPFLHASLISNI